MQIPYFKLGCNLEINQEQLATYLNNTCDICNSGSNFPYNGLRFNCSCPDLRWTTLENEDGDLEPYEQIFTAPDTDDACWYDPDVPESAQFLGYWIEDVNIMSVPSRTVTTRASAIGGGILGPSRNKQRQLDFTVWLFACSNDAMQWGFRYLTDALGAPGCDDDCVLCDAQYREVCPSLGDTPTVDEIQSGIWNLKNVGLTAGPDWADDPAKSAGYYIKRVTFTLVSEYPFKYRCPVTVVEDEAFEPFPPSPCQGIDAWFCETESICGSVDEPLNIGESAIIVDINNATNHDLGGVMVKVTPDQFGWVCDPGSAPAGYTPPDPCATIYITRVPSGARLVFDTTIDNISIILPGGRVIDGTAYIDFRQSVLPTFPVVRCGSFCVCIEVDKCSVRTGATASISSVHREI